jgi:hypothetical protein
MYPGMLNRDNIEKQLDLKKKWNPTKIKNGTTKIFPKRP